MLAVYRMQQVSKCRHTHLFRRLPYNHVEATLAGRQQSARHAGCEHGQLTGQSNYGVDRSAACSPLPPLEEQHQDERHRRAPAEHRVVAGHFCGLQKGKTGGHAHTGHLNTELHLPCTSKGESDALQVLLVGVDGS